MPKKLSPESDFIVADSTIVNLLIAAFFLMMFITAVIYNSGSSVLDWLLYFGIVPAIVFTKKAFVKKVAIIVNKKGIFFSKTLITDWQHFKNANTKQLPIGFGRVSDNVVLTVEYFNDGRDFYYERTMSLTNTQNKSEEEIIAAIEFFYNFSQYKI